MQDQLVVLKYTLSSGLKGQRNITSEQLEEWIDCFKTGTMFVAYVGEEVYGLHPDMIAEWSVQGKFSPQRHEINSIDEKEELSAEYDKVLTWYRIECKCGAEYEIRLSEDRTKTGCNACHEMVLADKKNGKIKLDNGDGYIMTNRRFVDMSYRKF